MTGRSRGKTFIPLALGRDGTVMACGMNEWGQLGLGDNADRDTFTVVTWSTRQCGGHRRGRRVLDLFEQTLKA